MLTPRVGAVFGAVLGVVVDAHPRQVKRTDFWYDEVSSSDYHTCGVRGEGELECWGSAHEAERVPDGFLVA